eukprot:173653-Chlamydomonas_euryale.AAC.2
MRRHHRGVARRRAPATSMRHALSEQVQNTTRWAHTGGRGDGVAWRKRMGGQGNAAARADDAACTSGRASPALRCSGRADDTTCAAGRALPAGLFSGRTADGEDSAASSVIRRRRLNTRSSPSLPTSARAAPGDSSGGARRAAPSHAGAERKVPPNCRAEHAAPPHSRAARAAAPRWHVVGAVDSVRQSVSRGNVAGQACSCLCGGERCAASTPAGVTSPLPTPQSPPPPSPPPPPRPPPTLRSMQAACWVTARRPQHVLMRGAASKAAVAPAR